ncbi:COX15/CtaA family protein [Amycolatopsis suaedae]|uniref:COX15/CtaA family protein n=1 Tax=Amycolatopsis suaedae TaxID=2510978 RepID=UPI00196A6132|nr:COX15/CtaA family protein [Amycolatopsis suaedae]
MVLSKLVARLPYPSPGVQRAVAVAAVISQAGIGVTGSIVRVTGSGLGCPTWPQCFSGSMFPVDHPEYAALNQWIEFSNRMLSGVLVVVSALCVLMAMRIQQAHPGRRRLVALAWTMPGGVVAQAVLGGITVLNDLLWWTVALHFLASTPLVWLAVLFLRALREGDEPPRWLIPPLGRRLLAVMVVLLGGILAAGTLVTGAGPHGGDPDTPRLQAPIDTLVTVHSGLLIAYLIALAILGIQFVRAGVPAGLWRRYGVLWVITLAQGGLGSLQYALGIPEALVSLHVLGSAVVIVATAVLWCAARDRGPLPYAGRPTAEAELATAD